MKPFQRTYQVPDNYLRTSVHSQMQRRPIKGVLDSRINIRWHANKKQHGLHINVVHSWMKEITPFWIKLQIEAVFDTESC